MRWMALAGVVLGVGCGPATEMDASITGDGSMDAFGVVLPDPSGCCPISSSAAQACGCDFLRGGSPTAGRCDPPVCDVPASRIVTDLNGCPTWINDDPCVICFGLDSGCNGDAGAP